MPNEQLTQFLSNAREATRGGEPNTRRGSNDPDVVFQSPNLVLTRLQEDALVELAQRRKKEIEYELGCNELSACSLPMDALRFTQLREKWMTRRQYYERMYDGNVAFRETLADSIYQVSNITLPMTRKIVQQQFSRAQNYFFDTEPYFSARPLRQTDPDEARKHEDYLKYKARASRMKEVLTSGLKRAFVNGEAVIKGTNQVDAEIYEMMAEIAVDENNEPILADGDYIFIDDEWVPLTDEEGTPLDMDGNPIDLASVQDLDQMESLTVYVLKKNPQISRPENLTFQQQKIRRQITFYEGADLDLVYYQDFLCPLTAKSVEAADCVVHLYDSSVAGIVQKYMQGANGKAVTDPKFLEMVEQMSAADNKPKSRDNQRDASGESGYHVTETQTTSTVEIGEFWIRTDLFGTGEQHSIMLVMDLTNKRPIFYEYAGNLTPDGKRPFRVLRVNAVENRWYGSSQVGLFWGMQELLDLNANRINLSQSNAGRKDFFNPDGVHEGDNNPNLTLNDSQTFTLKKGFTADMVLSSVHLSDIKHDVLMSINQMLQQFAQSLGGVASSNDADMAGLDSNKLATGIRHMERVGQEMFGPLIDDLIVGIQESIEMFFKIQIASITDVETYEFYRDGASQFAQITPQEIRNMDFRIEIELTTYKGEQMLAQNEAASAVVVEFYKLPFPVQQVVQRLYQGRLHALQIKDADAYIQPIDLMGGGGGVDQNLPVQAALPKALRTKPNL